MRIKYCRVSHWFTFTFVKITFECRHVSERMFLFVRFKIFFAQLATHFIQSYVCIDMNTFSNLFVCTTTLSLKKEHKRSCNSVANEAKHEAHSLKFYSSTSFAIKCFYCKRFVVNSIIKVFSNLYLLHHVTQHSINKKSKAVWSLGEVFIYGWQRRIVIH